MNNASEPAFPAWEMGGQGPEPTSFGLTKREWFAAMAMQGMISAGWDSGDTRSVDGWRGYMAHEAVRYADALLESLRASD